MAARKPIVLVNGQTQEIPAGDTVEGAANLTSSQAWGGAQVGTVTALTVVSNLVAVNMALSNNFSLSLQATTGQVLSNPTNAVAGQSGQFVLTQNVTPSTLAYGSNWLSLDGTIAEVSTTASAQNLLSYYVADSTHIWYSLNKSGVV